MRFFKIILKVISWLAILVAVCAVSAAAFYFGFLTPKKRAEAHLDYIHNTIAEMHPAMLDPAETEFHAWHKVGYEQAKARLAKVDSFAAENTLLQDYLVGYKDAHINGNLSRNRFPYSTFEPKGEAWVGWILDATPDGFRVIYSLGGEGYPPVGSRAISCNGEDLDTLLRTHYAKHVDMRWSILAARREAADLMFHDEKYKFTIERPSIKSCVFMNADSHLQEYPFVWRELTNEDGRSIKEVIGQKRNRGLREIDGSILWVYANDFGLKSQDAFLKFTDLISELAIAEKDKTLIFDVRSNHGGSSTFGDQLLRAAFGKSGFAFLKQHFDQKVGPTESIYRISSRLVNEREERIKELKKSQGSDSQNVKTLGKLVERMRIALEKNETYMPQRDPTQQFSQNSSELPNAEWRYKGRVVILTDSSCVSACLDFVDLLKQVPGVVQLGQATNADTRYTEISRMTSSYFKEHFNFIVPVKKWTARLRKDNEAYTPDIVFTGNMADDKALEQWVMETLKTLPTNSQAH